MKNLVAFLFLALPFGATSVIAALIAPFMAWSYETNPYAKNLLRAMDRLGAALFGASGMYTVSAECGARTDCALCMLVCKLLDWIQPGHCAGAAKKEGLL